MAHNISRVAGRDEMMYFGDTPWHGLGTKVDAVATSEEALAAAHLDWTVEKRDLYYDTGDGVLSGLDGSKAVVRQDTNKVLAIMSDGFRPIQNREAFTILDALVGEQAAMFHTAGAINDGRKVWALVKLPQTLVVAPDDIIEHYLLLANSHDGSMALTMRPTDIRVVCNNTLDAALGASVWGRQRRVDGGIYIRHSLSAEVRLADARRILGIALKTFEYAGESYRAMSLKSINEAMLKGYLNVVFPVKADPAASLDEFAAAEARQKNIHESIAFLFENGRGNTLPGVKGTAWAAYNAVTEWIDHVNVCTKAGELKATGLSSALFGLGAQTRANAYKAAVALVG